MKKIGIITLTGYFNYGNRLQNYALAKVLSGLGFEVKTIWDIELIDFIKLRIKMSPFLRRKNIRTYLFYKFTKQNIKNSYPRFAKERFDYIAVGSDQVWNPRYVAKNIELLHRPRKKETVFSYAASIGYDTISDDFKLLIRERTSEYSGISVREQTAKSILQGTVKQNVVVVLDPTLLLDSKQWENVTKKPSFNLKHNFIVSYFLGDLPEIRKQYILDYSHKNNCEIIELSKEGAFNNFVGPSEFLYLIKNAKAVFTDSFHACVFSFIFEKPFLVFKREGVSNHMYSRISDFLNCFELKKNECDDYSSLEDMVFDYSKSKRILTDKRKESMDFLKTMLNLI